MSLSKILIVVLPVWLAVSGGIGLWLHFQQQEKERQEQKHAYRQDIRAESVADDMQKIVERIGARHEASEAGKIGLVRMAAMIEGALGLNNIGYEVSKVASRGDDENVSPILLCDVMRRQTAEEIWVLVPYDSPSDLSRGQASASAVAVSFAVAQSLVGSTLPRNIRFAYLPSAHGAIEQRREMTERLQRLMKRRGAVVRVAVIGSMISEDLVVQDMGKSPSDQALWSELWPANEWSLSLLRAEGELPMNEQELDSCPVGSKVLASNAAQVVEQLRTWANEPQKK
ncbi:MAG: hypothetical protein EAZ81_09065 [Verrucomicrobia bacterium]|nr:MAG: hypothetical protein EAZ81_09065 [Verrucomicrobiota bacterium]